MRITTWRVENNAKIFLFFNFENTWKTRHHVVVKIYIIVRKETKNETFLALRTIEVPLSRLQQTTSGADLGGGCRGCAPPLPWDDLRFSNTTGILQKTIWFIGVEVEQETSAAPPKKNPGSAPAPGLDATSTYRAFSHKRLGTGISRPLGGRSTQPTVPSNSSCEFYFSRWFPRFGI